MTILRRDHFQMDVKWALPEQQHTFLRRFLRNLRDQVLSCSCADKENISPRFRRLDRTLPGNSEVVVELERMAAGVAPVEDGEIESDSVPVKISVLGDCRIGKTSFVMKYVGDGDEQRGLEMAGVNLMNKMFFVKGVRIIHSIWDVGGDQEFVYHLPIACKDSAAILFMFDLTNRCTLNHVIGWYREARKWNKTAIPILIGTKFDDFIQLPIDMQWTIVTQARSFARAMNAALFFSSATHNINVNKIFKFITARIFSLPWTVERNLTLGEPIIDF